MKTKTCLFYNQLQNTEGGKGDPDVISHTNVLEKEEKYWIWMEKCEKWKMFPELSKTTLKRDGELNSFPIFCRLHSVQLIQETREDL